MDIHFSLETTLNFIAFLVSLLYAFQVIALRNKTQANRFFSFLILNLGFISLVFFLSDLGFQSIILSILLIVALLIMPVNLWVYLKKLIAPESRRTIRYYLPIIYFLIVVVIIAITLNMLSKKPGGEILVIPYIKAFYIFTLVFFICVNSIYIVKSFRLLKQHKKRIQNYYSYTQEMDLKWAKIMLYGYVLLFLFLIAIEFIPGEEINDIVYRAVMIIYIIYIGHNAVIQREIWIENKTPDGNPKSKKTSENDNLETYLTAVGAENESYSESQQLAFKELKTKLLLFMEEEKPFLDQELSMFKLAKDLNTNTKYLSLIINHELNQNFMNFINEYRIEEMKKLLKENKSNFTIEAMAQSVGFKSKSSFNIAFKKSTGQTPSSYMNTIKSV